uniref:C2H2-type domain-containing protein n=1 Tax=Neogobius melanostomus TaxID=47308 RepID=A0A8C6WIE7_9GOBI
PGFEPKRREAASVSPTLSNTPVPESSAVRVKSEVSPFDQLMETEADGDDDNQVQSRDRRTNLSPNNKSVPETTVHKEDKLGPDAAEQKKHQCSVCNKRFGDKSKLQRHIRVHTGDKPFRCSSCEKAFTQKVTLDKHMRTHTGEKPFTCPTCETKFARDSTLKNHMRTHTGEKPYSCSICEKTFIQKSSLNSHRRTHTGEKPFTCPTCETKFAHDSTLKNHMRTHTGERPYSCQACGKTFTRIAYLNTHRRTHTVVRNPSLTTFSSIIQSKTNYLKSGIGHLSSKSECIPPAGKR